MTIKLLALIAVALTAGACELRDASFTSPSSGFSVSSEPVAMVWPAPATAAGVRKASASGPVCSGQPSGLTNSVAGSTVTLNWSAPAGCAPSSYTIEAGSVAGASNIIVFDTGNSATSLVAPNVGDGVYFVRVRVGNATSNETVVTVGAQPASPAPADLAGMWIGSPVSLLVAGGRVAEFGVQSRDWPCHWLEDRVQDIRLDAQAVIGPDGRFSMVVNSANRVYSQSANSFVVSGQFTPDGHGVKDGFVRFSYPGIPPECGAESKIPFEIKR